MQSTRLAPVLFVLSLSLALLATPRGSRAAAADNRGLAGTSFLSTDEQRALEASGIHVVDPSECPEDARDPAFFGNSRSYRIAPPEKKPPGPISEMLRWTPDASGEVLLESSCEPRALESMLAASAPARQAALLRSYVNECGAMLRRKSRIDLLSLFWMTRIDYDVCDHPQIRKVHVRLADGNVLRGLLALKPGRAPRPLVILKCGLMCNGASNGNRFMIMHLFDESPFNVLALGNVTGTDFIRDNAHLALGGFDEGQQLLDVARLLKAGPLASRISSLHAVGVSLAGQAALYAAYFNSRRIERGEESLISSSLALCPVVDLQASMSALFTRKETSKMARGMFIDSMKSVLEAAPLLRPLFPVEAPTAAEIPGLVASQVVSFYTARRSELFALDGAGDAEGTPAIRSEAELWSRNRFEDLAQEPMRTPTLVFGALNDRIVPPADNSLRLEQALANRATAGDALQVVVAPHGDHCAFDTEYGWQPTSAVLRGFITSHSPELLARPDSRHSVAFDPSLLNRFARELLMDETHHLATFRFHAGEDRMTLTSWILKGDRAACALDYDGGDRCFRKVDSQLPLGLFRGASWARVPRSAAEAEAMTRWANVNLELVDARGTSVRGTRNPGSRLAWDSRVE